jgi:Ribosomal protein L34
MAVLLHKLIQLQSERCLRALVTISSVAISRAGCCSTSVSAQAQLAAPSMRPAALHSWAATSLTSTPLLLSLPQYLPEQRACTPLPEDAALLKLQLVAQQAQDVMLQLQQQQEQQQHYLQQPQQLHQQPQQPQQLQQQQRTTATACIQALVMDRWFIRLPSPQPVLPDEDSLWSSVPLLCIKRTYQPHVHRYKRKHGFLKRCAAAPSAVLLG